ncbi:hypothetical protein [Rubrivirga sp. IMCC43871]|uniref:hypothetical protein n=1 Tax=Rubrivirga sp. IMCC43871 TaxID=3391575 RepID=UPI00398FB198
MSDSPSTDDSGADTSGRSDSDPSDSGNGSGGSGDGSGSSDSSGSGSDKDKNWLEWTITALGGALVVFVLGFLIYEWATDTGQAADLRVSLGELQADSSFVEIPVTVENQGGKVAVAAVIEVCAGPDACSEVTFAYIPFKSTVTGSVGFRAPLAAPPTTRVVSYGNP